MAAHAAAIALAVAIDAALIAAPVLVAAAAVVGAAVFAIHSEAWPYAAAIELMVPARAAPIAG